MGKMTLATKPKKADDVVGLITPTKTKKKNTTPEPIQPLSPAQPPSPTPKHPLSKTKSGWCRRIFLFSLGVFVVLVLFLSSACLVDYHQGNLAAHAGQLPREMREFPKQAVKYVVEVLYQTPKDLHLIFYGALNQVKNWTRKTDSDPILKTWEEIKVGKSFTTESQKLFHNSKAPVDQGKQAAEETGERDEEWPSLYEEGNDDTVVEEGLDGVAQFFVNILNDVSSIFEASEDGTAIEEDGINDPDGSSIENDIYMTNDILRKTDVVETSERGSMTQSGFLAVGDAQARRPDDAFEHTTENENDWDDEVIEVMEEIYHEDGTAKITSKEKFRNLLNGGDNKKHIHESEDMAN